jgi:4-hydroxy-tetrahydrodipicolinate synthase
MKKKTVFRGAATALVTPFKDGSIDFTALGNIIDFQISCGIDALVICGTTGEASTLSENERMRIFEFTKERAQNKVPLIFGTGTNNTTTSVEYTRLAKKCGADAALVVTPYYNKGTESGIISHYMKIADAEAMPIILYNVPARTGVNLSISAIDTLSSHENIVAIKEASDSADRLTDIAAMSDRISLYTGNDSQIYTSLALGGLGVISVASNILPVDVLKVTRGYFSGKKFASFEAQKRLLPFIKALFIQTNPSPIKYAMSLGGFCEEEMRLPLSPPTDEVKSLIEKEYKKLL